MLWFSKKSARRLAMKADAAEAASQSRISRERLGPIVLISSVFFVIAAVFLCYPADPVPYEVGDKAAKDLVSPITFTIEKPLMKETVALVRKMSPPVLVVDYNVLKRVLSSLSNLPIDVGGAASFDQVPAEVKAQWKGLTPESFAALKGMNDTRMFNQEAEQITRNLMQTPLIDAATMAMISGEDNRSPNVCIATGPKLEDVVGETPRGQIIVLGGTPSAGALASLRVMVGQYMPRSLVEPVVRYLLDLKEPLLTYNRELSEQVQEKQVAAQKKNSEVIAEGALIAQAGKELDQPLIEKLTLAQSYYAAHLREMHPWARWLGLLGQVMTVLVLTAAGALYVTYMNTSEITVRRGWALALLLLSMLVLAKVLFVALKLGVSMYLVGTLPVLLATIIMTMAFNQRFALGISAIHALLVTMAIGQSIDFYLALLTGVGIFVYSLKEIRTRSKLVEVGLLASLGLAAAVCALGLAHFAGSIYTTGTTSGLHLEVEAMQIRYAAGWAAFSGFFVAVLATAILPWIEKTFKITTGSTLLELCDLNKDLLKRLAAEAPGTFNHSLIVGTLAEAAGNAIGANGLLCRVGAYYHDIGKLSKPQYFIENQSGGQNRHDKLSPAMSLLIIVGHVKDGIELAREYGLPWIVHQFIGQHHGTTLVEYFFHAARERQAREMEARGIGGEMMQDVQEVAESEFRYPGPRPQTRETAILMICDGVESIVRSMPEPTAGRIETAVHQLVMKRLMDGQFSECDLTLRDLSDIEQALLRTLAGVYHGRVAYPKPLKLSQGA